MAEDLITITLEREKAEYLAACFEDDLEWLGVTAGIDRGLCYHDFIKQVKKQRKSPEILDLTDQQYKNILEVLENYTCGEESSEAVDKLENICDKIQDYLDNKGAVVDDSIKELWDDGQ